MRKYVIDINPEKCTACRICELSCSFKNHGEINPSKSRIKVNIFHDDFFFYPHVCSQCEEAWCAAICPNHALIRDPKTGVVKLDETRCVGCRMCVQACPFGAMGFDMEKGISEKCELCDGDPECVKSCFYGALTFKRVDNVTADKGKRFAKQLKNAKMKPQISASQPDSESNPASESQAQFISEISNPMEV